MKLGIPLTSTEQLEEIINLSHKPETQGVVLFKHSTRCSVSYMAAKNLQSEWQFPEQKLPFYYLDLLTYRALSNEISRIFNVKHESPQLLFIKNGICLGNASHTNVSVLTVENWIDD